MVVAAMSSKALIDDFLSQKRIAVAGVSRNQSDFSRTLFRDLRKFGYDVVPVHSEAGEIEGSSCFRKVQDIAPPVDGVLIMTGPEATEQVVRDCDEAGVTRVWMYRATGRGAVSQEAVDYCREKGIDVIPGECPYMFIQQAGWFHHFHGFLLKITGKYPR
jgi:predicted CoA-binding protein